MLFQHQQRGTSSFLLIHVHFNIRRRGIPSLPLVHIRFDTRRQRSPPWPLVYAPSFSFMSILTSEGGGSPPCPLFMSILPPCSHRFNNSRRGSPLCLVMSRGFQGFIDVQVFYVTKINYSYKTHTSNMLLMPNFWRGLV